MEKDFLPLQALASDLYYDIEESPKASSIFQEIQSLMGMGGKRLIRPISNRFLQMRQVADRLDEVSDALSIYYSCFLTAEEQKSFEKEIQEIFSRNKVNTQQARKIKQLLHSQRQQQKSSTSTERKDRILLHLFHKKAQTTVAVQLHRGILREFEGYALLFQNTKPMVHKLHGEMFHLIKQYFKNFIQSQSLPLEDAHALFNIDVEDDSIQLPDSELGVGDYCYTPLLLCRRDKAKHSVWLPRFYSTLRSAYKRGAMFIKKLPLLNKNLIALSALDPGLQRSEGTPRSVMNLAKRLPNVIPIEDLGKLDREVKQYGCDENVSKISADETSKNFRLDSHWWSKVMKMEHKGQLCYPTLTTLVKGLLTVFSGPIVESSFNIMGDIVEEDRTALTVEHYEALAVIKQRLCALGQTAATMNVSEKMRRAVKYSHSRYMASQMTEEHIGEMSGKETNVAEKPKEKTDNGEAGSSRGKATSGSTTFRGKASTSSCSTGKATNSEQKAGQTDNGEAGSSRGKATSGSTTFRGKASTSSCSTGKATNSEQKTDNGEAGSSRGKATSGSTTFRGKASTSSCSTGKATNSEQKAGQTDNGEAGSSRGKATSGSTTFRGKASTSSCSTGKATNSEQKTDNGEAGSSRGKATSGSTTFRGKASTSSCSTGKATNSEQKADEGLAGCSSGNTPSSSSDRSQYFKELSRNLQEASSFKEFQEISQKAEKEIKRWPIQCQSLLQADEFSPDLLSQCLYPTDAPVDLMPVRIFGDGNCLPRCGSLLASGSEHTLYEEMRVRIAVELAVHEDHYLAGPRSDVYAQFSQYSGQTKDVYEKEAMQAVVPSTYMGIWQMQAEWIARVWFGHTNRFQSGRAILKAMSPTPPPDADPDLEVTDLVFNDVPVRVYRPRSASVPTPALMHFHGGGWSVGSIYHELEKPSRYIARHSQVVVVAVEYRLAPEHPFPAPLDDCVAAIVHVLKNGHELGIDTNKVGVAGLSAGGNLAATVSLRLQEPEFQTLPKLRYQVLLMASLQAVDLNLPSTANEVFTGGLLSREDMASFLLSYAGLDLSPDTVQQVMRNQHVLPETKARLAKYVHRNLVKEELERTSKTLKIEQ
ncbi:hypothetical protein BaRGS_00036880, partial [Batillaria attramentaria]